MANSKYEYVRNFETDDKLLPNCWIVVRIDGRRFHEFSKKHKFEKPNDARALNLMNKSALQVMNEFNDIVLAYGQSDEYSFVFRKSTDLYQRRASKIASSVNSLFSSSYVFFWDKVIDYKLKYPPSFDARTIMYPTDQNLKDYLSWRQIDCHINNLYNTTFWNLVQKGGLSNTEAEKRLCGTVSADKHEILFSAFGINYNNEPLMFKKGTTLIRKRMLEENTGKNKVITLPVYEDMMKEEFWQQHSELLQMKSPGSYTWLSGKPIPELALEQWRKINPKDKVS